MLSSGALAKPVTQHAKAGPQRELAIAGVEAYQPVVEAERTLEAAGFTRAVSTKERSFQGRVEFAIGQARGEYPKTYSEAAKYQVWKKGGESISLWFLQLPEGAVVKQIRYELHTSNQSADQVYSELTRRYGTPDVKAWNKITGNTVHWCTPKSEILCDYTETNLAMSATKTSVSIVLNIDNRREQAVDALVQAEARKFSGRASF